MLTGLESSDPDGRIEDYRWEIETVSGEIITTEYGRPTHTWSEGGTYEVTLIATDNGGKSSSVTRSIDIGNTGPTAELSYTPESPQYGEEVTLNGSQSSDNDGEVQSWDWKIETVGGMTETKFGPETTYAWEESGTYEVTLTVTDNGGATDTATQTVEVSNKPPEVAFSYQPIVPESGSTVTFDGSDSTDPDGTIAEYIWEVTYDGESIETARGETVEIQFDNTSTHTVSLTVVDEGGEKSTTQKELEIRNQAPEAEIEIPTEEPIKDQAVILDGSSSIDNDGDVVNYQWTVQTATGEQKFTGPTVEHRFAEPGEYKIQLTIKDDAGDTDTTTTQLEISDPPDSESTSSDQSQPDRTETESDQSDTERDGAEPSLAKQAKTWTEKNESVSAALAGLGSSAALIGGYKIFNSESDDN